MSVDLGPGSNWADFCCPGWNHPDMLVVPAFILWGMIPGSGSFYLSVPERILFYCYSLISESEKNPPVLPTSAFGFLSIPGIILFFPRWQIRTFQRKLIRKHEDWIFLIDFRCHLGLMDGNTWSRSFEIVIVMASSHDDRAVTLMVASTHDALIHPPTVNASELETNVFNEMFLHFSFWLILSLWFVWSFLLNPRRCRSNIYIAAPLMSPGGDGEPGD